MPLFLQKMTFLSKVIKFKFKFYRIKQRIIFFHYNPYKLLDVYENKRPLNAL